MISYNEIKKNKEILAYIHKGNENLRVSGFTDHSEGHTGLVAERAAYILSEMGYTEHEQELVKIAGFMHDINNRLIVNVDDRDITLELEIDEKICTMYDYFDIFLQRMLMSRAAAEILGAQFSLNVNGNKVL